MFDALDRTLKVLLGDTHDELTRHGETHISFETPNANFAPMQQTLNLFLHDVSENRDLRENAPQRAEMGGKVSLVPPPLRLDCRYLVTAWSPGTGESLVFEEHRLLGWALRTLSRSPVIPVANLDSGLKSNGSGTTWEYPLPTLVAQMENGKPATDFWQALGISPRASFELVVTVAMPLFDAVAEPIVDRGRLEIGISRDSTTLDPSSTLDLVHVYQVLSNAAPVARAAVTVNGVPLMDRSKEVKTDSLGRFFLRNPPQGDLIIHITPEGAPSRQFEVKAASREKASTFTLDLNNGKPS